VIALKSWLNQRQRLPFLLPLLDRYVMAQMSAPLIFGVVLFTAIGAAIGIVFELVRLMTDSGLAIAPALKIFAFSLPTFIALAFPMSTLLTTLMVYSDFSRNSELVALRSCGVSAYRLAIPAILVGLLMTGLTFAFNEIVVPQSVQQASLTRDIALDDVKPSYKQKNIFYREFSGNQLSRIFFARNFDGQQMKRITVLDFSQSKLREITAAETGIWNESAKAWLFKKITLYTLSPDQTYRSIEHFPQQRIALPRTPLDLASETRPTDQMNIADARHYLSLLEQTGDIRRIRRLKVRIQEKLSLPFVCFIFSLIGSALGMQSRRAVNARSFSLCFGILFAYYVLSYVCSSLGVGGILPAALAAWFPKAVCLAAGAGLVAKAAQ
jgi:lipopolysaccharide export system permease protein